MRKVTTNFPLWHNDENVDTVDAAEECLDLPPIVPFIPDRVPKALEKSHEIVCKKLEQFRQIDTSSDDPILYETRSGRKKSKDRSQKSSTKNPPVLHQISIQNENKQDENVKNSENNSSEIKSNSYKTLSTYMDISLFSNL